MSNQMDEVFCEGVNGLAPYLPHLVIAGGWAPYLYGRMYGAMLRRDPLMTRDMDVVIPGRSFADGMPSLDKTIIGAGFEHKFASLTKPPVVKYVKDLGEEQQVEIEFITDAPGDFEGAVEIGSVNAQSLHFVGLLLDDPWECNLGELGFPSSHIVRIPNPSAYIFHKALVAPRRRERAKTAKDFYYIFYILDSFPEWKHEVLAGVSMYGNKRGKWLFRAKNIIEKRFAAIDSEGVRMLVGQRPSTAFPNMDDDQFSQYALSVMGELREAMSIDG